ncbi:MAG: hypothetical protein HWE27_08710 [Gammaproteobacteria bacterium]|nr:hypothetical protein [Gammaproteobacteria bacterium]
MKFVYVFLLSMVLIGCANRPIEYTVDPDVSTRESKLDEALVVSINVVAPKLNTVSDESQVMATPSNEFADSVKRNLLARFINQGYQVSSNKHFTNANLTFDFSKFQVVITKGTVKDELSADGQLNLLITRKNSEFKKSFSVRKTMTVALKATPPEVTGLANEVVGKLLNNALNDPQVIAAIKQSNTAGDQ